MDQRIHHYYERELRYVRELGAEFVRRFPKVASRLGVSQLACEDPHVERLFQGFSWLGARVHQRLDAEFPSFTAGLMGQLYPHYHAPTPSMTVVQFVPDPKDGSLHDGFVIPRGTQLRARSQLRGMTQCEYRTAHAVELWPLTIESLEYSSVLRDFADLRIPTREPVKALLRLQLRVTGGRRFQQLKLSTLPLYLAGADDRSGRLFEALAAHVGALALRWGPSRANDVAVSTAAQPVRALGFDPEHALLPPVPQGFEGYRLLQEYFAFPTRFHFVELCGLAAGIQRCNTDRLEVLLPLTRFDATLEGVIESERVLPFATPAINLFPHVCDPVPLTHAGAELLLEPDRARPLDFEVHTLTQVATSGRHDTSERTLLPSRALCGRLERDGDAAHYSVERRPRVVPFDEQRLGGRAQYPGSDVFVTLAEDNASRHGNSRQLMVDALCTNRDLPLLLVNNRTTSFSMHSGAPASRVQCVAGPTAPRYTQLDGDTVWRLLSHLSLNYLCLSEQARGPAALREMLELYGKLGDPRARREIDGVRGIASSTLIRPLPGHEPREFVRGLEVRIDLEEQAFSAHGAFTLASVLSAFFTRHASVHSFTETVLWTRERGEVYRWPTARGTQHVL